VKLLQFLTFLANTERKFVMNVIATMAIQQPYLKL